MYYHNSAGHVIDRSRTSLQFVAERPFQPRETNYQRGRGRGVHRGSVRGQRAGARGRRAQAAVGIEEGSLAAIEGRKERMTVLLKDASADRLRELFSDMMAKYPSLVFDVLEPPPQRPQGYDPPDSPSNKPDWCVCGHCREMPSDIEKKCCMKQSCTSLLEDIRVLVLDEGVLMLARRYRMAWLRAADYADNNKANRHAAYRQYILWTCGRLGADDRRVIPSCCVWRIRDKYPDPFGQYTGFKGDRFA